MNITILIIWTRGLDDFIAMATIRIGAEYTKGL